MKKWWNSQSRGTKGKYLTILCIVIVMIDYSVGGPSLFSFIGGCLFGYNIMESMFGNTLEKIKEELKGDK